MPIKPENKARYPVNWPAIREGILQRAGLQCEHVSSRGKRCLAHQYAVGWWHDTWGGPEFRAEWPRDGRYIGQTFKDARAVAAGNYHAQGESGAPPIVIVLTVAHLDHQPENCDPENLRALCQRHHLAHDHEHHRANAQATRRARLASAELF